MAHRFVGSNNMPLLFNDGQFGSRDEAGKDGASGRYIFTKLEMYTREVFPIEDDDYLENVEDDGDIVEKIYYVPVIPMILVNGTSGIGTGFSTNIPSYDPIKLIEWIRVWIKTGGKVTEDLGDGVTVSEGPDLIPWYRGFKGVVKLVGSKIFTYGVIEDKGKGKYRVTELPVGMKNWSIRKFKNKLEELLEKKVIKDFDDHSNDVDVNFTILEDPDGLNINLETLGLVDVVHTSNMVLFTDDHKIKKYSTVEEIMNDFCKRRLELYVVRRAGELKKLEDELKYTNNKIRFIKEVNLLDTDKDKLVIKDREDDDLYNEMDGKGYDRKVDKQKKKEDKKEDDEDEKTGSDEDEEEDEKKEGNYNYLLNLKMRGAMKRTMDELIKEKSNLEKSIVDLYSKKPEDLWEEDLVRVEKKYIEWLPHADEEREEKSDGKKKTTRKKTK